MSMKGKQERGQKCNQQAVDAYNKNGEPATDS